MREVTVLEKGWKFCLTKLGTERMPDMEHPGWQEVTVPHDWAITGDFSPENDPQPLENSVLDYHPGMIQIGRTGGLPISGTGWYVLDLSLDGSHDVCMLEFDGIMNHGEVFFNGQKVAYRPYGYSSFMADVTPYVKKNEKNQIIVKVNALDKTSRWYPGAGMIRPARLILCDRVHINYHGIWVKSNYDLKSRTAKLEIHCELSGEGDIRHTIFAPDGHLAAQSHGAYAKLFLSEVQAWDTETPVLYTLMTEAVADGGITDRVYTKFGIRKADFDRETGFSLNGRRMKIHGVCLHHDFGMLGAAYRREAAYIRLSELKKMGCNAIRTTHNPPCPETLDICDELGILVLEEAFDVWLTPKALHDYANEFAEWGERDLTDMIRRDRNHPSVILYSIGNEIPDQVRKEGREIAARLTKICHREDDTRPVTCGFNRPAAAVENKLTEEVDVVGLNYSPEEYQRYHEKYPHWKIIATETCSSVSTRGEYYLPAEVEVPPVKHANLQVNSYDYSAVACAYISDVEFKAQREAPFVAGEFVWTGFDYLGEPTPYREEWPSRSSYFGIFDLAGLKKDRYYAYAANWGKEPVIHIFPHWNWKSGQLVDVHCYTNLPLVRLYLNGSEVKGQKREGHRIIFEKVPFEPGELRAVGYCFTDGKKREVCQDIVRTSKAPWAVELNCEKKKVRADGRELIYINVRIVDEDGNLCPLADNRVEFLVEGQGSYLASDAGDPTSLRRFQEPYCDVFHGKAVAALCSGTEPGYILVKAESPGLQSGFLILSVEK